MRACNASSQPSAMTLVLVRRPRGSEIGGADPVGRRAPRARVVPGRPPRRKTLRAPDGTDVALGTLLDAGRTETCLRTIAEGDGWPASWLIVSDSTKPYDLVMRVALAADGSIADPDTAFLASRRDVG